MKTIKKQINSLSMKKVVTILCLCLPLLVFSQSLEMLGDNTAWVYDRDIYKIGDERATFDSVTFFELVPTDTIVNDVSYRKMKISNQYYGAKQDTWDETNNKQPSKYNLVNKLPNEEATYDELYVLLRESDGKIYINKQSYIDYMGSNHPEVWPRQQIYLTDDNSQDQLLYDFSLNIGDRYPILGNVFVEKIDNVVTEDGVNRKLFQLSNGMEIIEGVGCVDCSGQLIAYQSLEKVATNDGVYLERGYSLEYYPNGFDNTGYDFEYIPLSIKNTYHDKIYPNNPFDLQGRRLKGKPTKGIYIENRKKKVAK